MKRTIEITEEELKNLKCIRNYFGEHDKTQLEHLAYSELDRLVKKLEQHVVICSVCNTPINLKENIVYDLKNDVCHKICLKRTSDITNI